MSESQKMSASQIEGAILFSFKGIKTYYNKKGALFKAPFFVKWSTTSPGCCR